MLSANEHHQGRVKTKQLTEGKVSHADKVLLLCELMQFIGVLFFIINHV